MMKLLLTLAVLAAAYAQDPPAPPTRRNPNVCEGVAATDISQFRNDFASCPDYFWCNGPQAVPTGPCPSGFIFDDTATPPVCAAGTTCDECPPAAVAPEEPQTIAVSFFL